MVRKYYIPKSDYPNGIPPMDSDDGYQLHYTVDGELHGGYWISGEFGSDDYIISIDATKEVLDKVTLQEVVVIG